jgi:hypothetical protein
MKNHTAYIQEGYFDGNYILRVEDKHGSMFHVCGTKRQVKARYKAFLVDLYTGVAKWPEKAVKDVMDEIVEL